MIAGFGGFWLAIGIALGVAIGSWMTGKSKSPERRGEQFTEALRR
jgi:hypothetical protein